MMLLTRSSAEDEMLTIRKLERPLHNPELGREPFDEEQQDQAIRALRREKAVA
jgi:hypothetical protein